MALGALGLLGITSLAGGISAGSNFASQAWAQNFNAEQAQLNRDFNAEQAQLARDWSKDMASTAYQRQVEDMKKAGVNPALLMGGTGGASTGQTASASSTPASSAPISGGLSSIFSSALQSSILRDPKNFTKALTDEISSVKKTVKSTTSHSALEAWQREGIEDIMKRLKGNEPY